MMDIFKVHLTCYPSDGFLSKTFKKKDFFPDADTHEKLYRRTGGIRNLYRPSWTLIFNPIASFLLSI